MPSFVTAGFQVVLPYSLAGVAYLLYCKWPHYVGHAHVPFSGFPEFLVWSPVASYFLLEDLLAGSSGSVMGLLVFGSALVGALCLFYRHRSAA